MRLTAPAAVIGTLAAVLTVAPAEAETPARATAKAGDLHRLTVPSTAAPGAVVTHQVRPAATATKTYTVKPGDTVYAIAARHGLRTADVLAWNALSWQSIIYPGQKLRLGAGATAPAPKPPAASTGATTATHTVVRGDTVYAIAKKYKTSVAAIIAANGLGASAMIHPGQKLRISGTATQASASTPAPKASAPKASAPKAAKKAETHKVVAGDTLFGIAKKHGTTVSVLLQANGLAQGSIIYPGQTLRLTAPPTSQRFTTLDSTQKAHAVHIIRVGRQLGVSDRGIAIALATAMVESSMRNLDHGDRDSLGLFQQRPSQGWGTRAQIIDADRSIRAFYGGSSDPNGRTTRGLLDIAGWQNMAFTDAAQAVQISAFPQKYGQWEQQANRWLATL
ncbi:LysM peptidoglycan-binding domain-containing protein [Microbacterium sp. Mu-80]|uniref:LysM peptidoglycan-binding domain-containing protein n=1 Tax=Microbacterium bandirmense TaxID=3122050 RepID=A0ABU8L7U3_9MICO